MGRRATPAPQSRFLGPGAIVVGIISAPFLAWHLIFGSWWPLFFLFPLYFYILHKLYGLLLLVAAWVRWFGGPVRGILVFSESPNWKEYVEKEWLSRLGARVVVLNWSNRRSWWPTLPVLVFHYFCCGQEQDNFNPAVILFRGIKYPYVYRYFYAFRDAKHGRPETLHQLETHMYAAFAKG